MGRGEAFRLQEMSDLANVRFAPTARSGRSIIAHSANAPTGRLISFLHLALSAGELTPFRVFFLGQPAASICMKT
jgi:hypothetical protein